MIDGAGERGLFFIRHGQTVANRAGVRSGAESDARLTALGREQARTAGLALERLGIKPGLIVASPLSRTRETAELLNVRWGLEVRIEPGLIERRLGVWNGMSYEATEAQLAAGETPPGGESSAVFKARVLTALRGLAPLYERWPLIVSSRGVARVLMEHAGHRGAAAMANGAVLRVTVTDSGGEDDFVIAGTDPLEPQAGQYLIPRVMSPWKARRTAPARWP